MLISLDLEFTIDKSAEKQILKCIMNANNCEGDTFCPEPVTIIEWDGRGFDFYCNKHGAKE